MPFSKNMHNYQSGTPADHAQNPKQVEFNLYSWSEHNVIKWWSDTTCINHVTNYDSTKLKPHLYGWLSIIMNLLRKKLKFINPSTAPSSFIICWGPGTLKLPMSFSKFSLCPPLGAACHMLQRGKEMWKSSLGKRNDGGDGLETWNA